MKLILAATYACISMYGADMPPPADKTGLNDAKVEYRAVGKATWTEAQPAWFDPRPVNDKGNVYGGQEYRGSVCGLQPGTAYDLRLTPSGGAAVTARASTWRDPPIGEVVQIGKASAPYRITRGGTADAYRVYERGEIDGAGKAEYGVVIEAPYVILRESVIRNATRHGIVLGPGHDENNADVHDIVIRDNDVSRWGSQVTDPKDRWYGVGRNTDSAIYSSSGRLRRITVERNQLHEPNFSANPWKTTENAGRRHPRGPQAITFNRNWEHDLAEGLYTGGEGKGKALNIGAGSNLARVESGDAPGNHVIRYNEIWSDDPALIEQGKGKAFNDVFGSFGSNGSNSGFLIRDTDIYGNLFLGRSWDDVIEGDGAYRNVRIWGNVFNNTFQGISLQGKMGGPAYVWDNVFGFTREGPWAPKFFGSGRIFKVDADSRGHGRWDTLSGRIYIERNTMAGDTSVCFICNGATPKDQVRNAVVRNNVVQAATSSKPAIRLPAGVGNVEAGNVSDAKFVALKMPTLTDPIGDFRTSAGDKAGASVLAFGRRAAPVIVAPIPPPDPPKQCLCPCAEASP